MIVDEQAGASLEILAGPGCQVDRGQNTKPGICAEIEFQVARVSLGFQAEGPRTVLRLKPSLIVVLAASQHPIQIVLFVESGGMGKIHRHSIPGLFQLDIVAVHGARGQHTEGNRFNGLGVFCSPLPVEIACLQ